MQYFCLLLRILKNRVETRNCDKCKDSDPMFFICYAYRHFQENTFYIKDNFFGLHNTVLNTQVYLDNPIRPNGHSWIICRESSYGHRVRNFFLEDVRILGKPKYPILLLREGPMRRDLSFFLWILSHPWPMATVADDGMPSLSRPRFWPWRFFLRKLCARWWYACLCVIKLLQL